VGVAATTLVSRPAVGAVLGSSIWAEAGFAVANPPARKSAAKVLRYRVMYG
jgi:hypothetical protein